MTFPKPQPVALAAAILSLGLAGGALAQTNAGQPPATPTAAAAGGDAKAVPRGERRFVEEAASGGMAEVQLGQLAQQKAQSDQVKQFASRMVQDHGKANDELRQVASDTGVQLPSGLDRKHEKEMQQLQKLSGAEFDRAYMKHMVGDHKKDIAEFEKESKSGKDPAIRDFAAKTLPTLQEHLKLAQSVNDAVKGEKGA